MKNRNCLLILFSLCIVCLGLSCKKEKLTKETQTGANTFSCKINGKIFKPCKTPGLFGNNNPLYGGISISGTTIARINAECLEENPRKRISITLDHFQGVGEYLLSDPDNFCRYIEDDPYKPFTSGITQNGKVIITKDDRVNHILSGRFEFTAANFNNTSEVVTITEGRFDLGY